MAAGSLLIERKFIRGCGKVGHIEDVVVDASQRRKGTGSCIVRHLVQAAQRAGCYKVILDCSAENATFYERQGFKRKEVQMAMYF